MGSNSLRTLNEQEIQERLYGRYHKVAAPVSRIPAQPAPVSLRASKSFKIASPDLAWIRPVFSKVQSFAVAIFKTFPWKFSLFVTGAVVLLTVLFQNLPVWIHRIQMSRPTQVSVAPLVPQETLETDTDAFVAGAPNLRGGTIVEKKKSYVVQVCTYQRKSDAERLVNELTSLNIPAHYIKMPVRGNLTHYLVVLGRDPTYAQARARLAEFRKTALYEKFSDSFIRSL